MQIFHAASRVLDAITTSLSPAPGATSREVRVNGSICVGLGFLMLAVAGGIIFLLPPEWSVKVALLPILFLYALWLIGGYRLTFGASPNSNAGPLDSIMRIGFGLVFILAMAGLFVGVAAL